MLPSEAAICHSSAIRQLLVYPVLDRPGGSVGAQGAGGHRSRGSELMGGLRLVHPSAVALHESAALCSALGVNEFSPRQLIGIVKVSGSLEGAPPLIFQRAHRPARRSQNATSSMPWLQTQGLCLEGKIEALGVGWISRLLMCIFEELLDEGQHKGNSSAITGDGGLPPGGAGGERGGRGSRGARQQLLRELGGLKILPLLGGGLGAARGEDKGSGPVNGPADGGEEGLLPYVGLNPNSGPLFFALREGPSQTASHQLQQQQQQQQQQHAGGDLTQLLSNLGIIKGGSSAIPIVPTSSAGVQPPTPPSVPGLRFLDPRLLQQQQQQQTEGLAPPPPADLLLRGLRVRGLNTIEGYFSQLRPLKGAMG